MGRDSIWELTCTETITFHKGDLASSLGNNLSKEGTSF